MGLTCPRTAPVFSPESGVHDVASERSMPRRERVISRPSVVSRYSPRYAPTWPRSLTWRSLGELLAWWRASPPAAIGDLVGRDLPSVLFATSRANISVVGDQVVTR